MKLKNSKKTKAIFKKKNSRLRSSPEDKQNDVYDVIIVGAGIAGLEAANRLKQSGLDILLLEGRNRLGGRIFTDAIGDNRVDLGASWIHGIGLGVI